MDELLSPISTSHTLDNLRLYSTTTHHYILGGNTLDGKYKILCIQRINTTFQITKQYQTPIYTLRLYEDNDTYTVESGIQQIQYLIQSQSPDTNHNNHHNTIDNTGGRKFSALLGFIRLPKLYMVIITKKQNVGALCNSAIYTCHSIEFVPVYYDKQYSTKDINQHIHSHTPQYKQYLNEYNIDQRYKSILLNSIDFKTNYYFSYNYDITHTMQYNASTPVTHNKRNNSKHHTTHAHDDYSSQPPHARQPSLMPDSHSSLYNTQFVWNCSLIDEFISILPHGSYWLVPLVHGYFSQVTTHVNTHPVQLTLLARRSQYYAGTRYIKRGIDEYGHVANEVETELILSYKNQSSNRIQYSSVVYLRGSIPLTWTQDNTFSAKPSIIVSTFDNQFKSSKVHFDDLFHRYGTPVAVLSLIKQTEKVPQECKLGYAFNHAINKLNDMYAIQNNNNHHQLLHTEKMNEIQYYTYDFLNNRAAKRNILYDLKLIVTPICQQISVFYYNGHTIQSQQNGILRVNCVDCLDRTNVAIFVAAKCSVRLMLKSMRLIDSHTDADDIDTELINSLQLMFTSHGDCIATQYAGSGAMHKHEIYGSDIHTDDIADSNNKVNDRTNKMFGAAQNAFTAAKRFYSNNITDYDKQHAYNILLGNFVPSYSEQEHIWDIDPHTHMPPIQCNNFIVPYSNGDLFVDTDEVHQQRQLDDDELSDDEISIPSQSNNTTKPSIASKFISAATSVDTNKLSMFGRQLASRFNKAIAGKPAVSGSSNVTNKQLSVDDMMSHADTPIDASDTGDQSTNNSQPNTAHNNNNNIHILKHSQSQPQSINNIFSDPFAEIIERNVPVAVSEPHSTQPDEFDDFVRNTHITPQNNHTPKSRSVDVDLLTNNVTSNTNNTTSNNQPSDMDDLFASLRTK